MQRRTLVGWLLMGLWTWTARDARAADFLKAQNAAPRVKEARKTRGDVVKKLFADAGVAYPPAQLHLRAFKEEDVVELWAGPADGPLTRVKSYAVCARSGGPGPKRREGDGQVPEGFYEVDRFNPASNFHLSLGLNYPNAADRIRIGKDTRTGGDIFIHGSCVTIGCLPLEDGPVEEVYLAAVDARAAGARRIPVHVFPRRMDDAGMEALRKLAGEDAALWAFWEQLRPAYDAFERDHRVPRVEVQKDGRYRVAAARGR